MQPIQIELPTVFEIMTVNTWLFLGEEPTLIDCGENTDKSWNALVKGLKENGLEMKDLKRVIITHGHLDHMGMAKRITEHSNAMIWVNEYNYPWALDLKTMLNRRTDAILSVAAPNFDKAITDKHFIFGYERLIPYWEEIPADRLVTFPMNGTIDIGGSMWEIIYTPGHCHTQTCFYNPENGYFISADALLKIIPIPIIDAMQEAPYTAMKSLMLQVETYHKMAKLNITKTFPGHYHPFENAQDLIENQLAKIDYRKEKCFSFIQDGETDLFTIANKIYPNRINAATLFMCMGFMNILEAEDRIERVLKGGKYRYYSKVVV